MNMNMYVYRMTEKPDSESAGEPGETFEAFNDEARYAGFMGRFCNGRGDDVENNRSGRLARAVSRSQRRGGRTSYGLLEKRLDKNGGVRWLSFMQRAESHL